MVSRSSGAATDGLKRVDPDALVGDAAPGRPRRKSRSRPSPCGPAPATRGLASARRRRAAPRRHRGGSRACRRSCARSTPGRGRSPGSAPGGRRACARNRSTSSMASHICQMSAWRATIRRPFFSPADPTTKGTRAAMGGGACTRPAESVPGRFVIHHLAVQQRSDDRQRLVEPVEPLADASPRVHPVGRDLQLAIAGPESEDQAAAADVIDRRRHLRPRRPGCGTGWPRRAAQAALGASRRSRRPGSSSPRRTAGTGRHRSSTGGRGPIGSRTRGRRRPVRRGVTRAR